MSKVKITAVITTKPEHRSELLEVLRNLVAASRKEAGNIRYDSHQDTENENRFVFFENWQNAEAVDRHNASEHFQSFLQAIENKVEDVEVMLLKDVSENID
ncbi:putative quinol monooxygenase [Neisseria canis]|uniref:Antibiotic biosynthesis monooxygenase family protein n=1 Tax=Neisseria canis TaxID=493 RepID=A0A448D8I8_9NEIS|nr:putative quinol monooxygenase [Neisseria canis]OSI12390.1 antibiotic biosynthesis monooxygenase [Neisseria canis]VEF01620.1 antibiotic biosynthesis monooxygenase family protein [Neisseria canis]